MPHPLAILIPCAILGAYFLASALFELWAGLTTYIFLKKRIKNHIGEKLLMFAIFAGGFFGYYAYLTL